MPDLGQVSSPSPGSRCASCCKPGLALEDVSIQETPKQGQEKEGQGGVPMTLT